MDHVLLSIKPIFVKLIIAGTKTIELRSVNLKLKPKQTIWIYSTVPDAAVNAVAQIDDIQRMQPGSLWRKHQTKLGLTKEEFDEYARGHEMLTAISLGKVRKLEAPVTLEEMRKVKKKFQPPQLAHYIEESDKLCTMLRVRSA